MTPRTQARFCRARARSRHAAAVAGLRLRRTRRSGQRGMALVLVLGALTILSVMLTETQDESSADFASALASRDQLVAEYAAKSGVNLSRLLIAAEPTIRGAMAPILMMLMPGGPPPQIPIWAHAEKALGAFNDADGVKSFSSLAGIDPKLGKNLGFDGAGFEIQIVDEDSKIGVNSPARGEAFSKARLGAQLAGLLAGVQNDALFSARDADGQFSDRNAICSAIIDWADPDQDQDQAFCDQTSSSAQATAPEDSFYTVLPRPYERKNAAFDSMEELRRVRGMSEDFWATFVDPNPDQPESRVLTVWGQGAVNVNTANPQTILALICSSVDPLQTPICGDVLEAGKFLGALSMVRSFTAGAPLFGSPKNFIGALKGKGMFGTLLTALGIQPVTLKSDAEFEKQISTESKVFSLYVTGKVRSGKRETRTRVHAVVDFRAAPPPGVDARVLEAATQLAAAADSSGTVEQQIDAVLKPQAGGSLIYFRVD
jgi:general secretion pathway protein K